MTPPGDGLTRCPWPGADPLYTDYHDREWGTPLRDERALFELLILEGFQAGLSWLTILRRRENFRRAFQGFDPETMAAYGPTDFARLLADPGIIRNRLKVEASARNARAFLATQERHGGFAAFLWAFVDNTPVQNAWERMDQTPATTPLSDAVSRALKAQGFTFVGSTIVYALLQSAGLVNDHLTCCFRHAQLARTGPLP
ncbi:DNA-3-methyladenine glycosylase 1 [Fundidesulfovibrio magnetotacticus]|uniref:DNA-3-methyladenine glycosylase 1 n=1 Tax=Fundidesulfovibrio magnetotacticus TaxID=2730080 RepID=A0A6V8LUC7_9BACT|nr:DNA-3-methyladenine glycosylase I [Fundidesulfovibrio magnetotacticus]GFK93719.1 DNA-3-methyladenine glycosylase 1 [Fundidesulfovibrio magnetotacticus]